MSEEARTVNAQRTLAGSAVIEGPGLFSGIQARTTIKPAPEDSGVVFVRTDLDEAVEIPACVDNVVDRLRRTALQSGDVTIETVEHCLSALAGLGVDNARIEIDAPELPACDGSAAPFVRAIEASGIVEQRAAKRPLVVEEPVIVRDGDATIAALPNPGEGLEVLYELDYGDEAGMPRQLQAFHAAKDDYASEIAPARTFALEHEARALLDQGLCAHLSPKDVLVIGNGAPIDNEYRFENEPVRHKVLDLLGDLSLVGRTVEAKIVATKSGHELNQQLARELFEQSKARESGALSKPAMAIRQILRMLPHRYPMVLVDRVLEIEGDQRAVGIKNVTVNEPFFQGHYPGSPMMPGVLIVEAMAQLAGLMLSQKLERTGKVAVLLSLERVKLRRPVTPGDQLVMETNTIKSTNRFAEVHAQGFVGGVLVTEARVKFMMVDTEQV